MYFDVGGDRELRNARVVVDARGRYRHAGIEVADHAADAGVDQPLRDDRAGLGIRLVVFRDELELDRLAAERGAARVELVDRHLRAVAVVLAVVRLRPGERRGEADLDDLLRLRARARQDQRHGEREQTTKRVMEKA